VIDTAQAILLVTTEENACPPVGTIVVKETYIPIGIAESYQVFTQKAKPDGITVGFRELVRQHCGNPKSAEQIPHGCSWSYSAKKLIVLV
jgi:hypothetical protein